MNRHPIEQLVENAHLAINREDFETLIDMYADDAVVVIKPCVNVVGKALIREAFEAIAVHFNHQLDIMQAGMEILECGDTALVLATTRVARPQLPPIKTKYVFKKSLCGDWVCTIHQSQGRFMPWSYGKPDVPSEN